MIRRLRAMFVIALMTVPFALSTSADAQTCAPTDLACTVGQVGGAAQGGVDTGQDAVHTAQTTTKDAVGTVRNTIDQVLGDGATPTLPGGGNGGTGGGGSGDRPNGSNGSSHNPHAGVGAPRPAGGAAGGGEPLPVTPTQGDEPGVPTADLSSHPSSRASSPTIGAVAAEAIVGVLLMAVLLGAVVAFLACQDRIDRRDPKLAMAAVGSDRVSFT